MLIASAMTLLIPSTPVAQQRLQRIAEEEGMMPTLTPPESPLTSE
jgi:hypothetical protein